MANRNIPIWFVICTACCLVVSSGCQHNPFAPAPGGAPRSFYPPPASGVPNGPAASTSSNAALNSDLSRRLMQLDENNRDLHTKLAQSEREVQGLREELTLVRAQLKETGKQLASAEEAKSDAETRVQTMQASLRHRGGATLTANSSMRAALDKVEVSIPGVTLRQDTDVIRLTVPADRIFVPEQTVLHSSSREILDRVAAVVAQHYPRQRIGIEGHIDSTPGSGPDVLHQITSAQALGVFQYLTRSRRMPAQQFVVTAHGANHPLSSNATPAGRAQNRRVELVVYPETF